MVTDLVQVTRTLLKASSQPRTEIAKGAGVSLRWLYSFESGDVENPTMRTIQGLHGYLTTTTATPTRRCSQARA